MSIMPFHISWYTFKIETLNLIFLYSIYLVCGVLQVVFIFLPVFFKNWEEDMVNVWTYVAVQGFVSAMLFIVMPLYVDVIPLQATTQVFILCGMCLLALVRATCLIPLELSSMMVVFPILETPWAVLSFAEFENTERIREQGIIPADSIENEMRYHAIKQKLRRKQQASSDD